jgi:DNA-binding NarL/FixJ family response regulator
LRGLHFKNAQNAPVSTDFPSVPCPHGKHGEAMKLLIVDDDSIMSQALASGLTQYGITGIEVAQSASDAMKVFRISRPNVCLIDIELKAGPTGIDLSHAMRRVDPEVGIIFLTSLSDPRLVDSAIPRFPEGAVYLVKSAVKDLSDVAEIIKVVSEKDVKKIRAMTPEPSFLNLTTSQFEIIRMIAEGHSNIEISKLRVTTVKSTENAIARLAKRVGIGSSSSASQRVLLTRKYLELIGKL